jgi:hypothetical protein
MLSEGGHHTIRYSSSLPQLLLLTYRGTKGCPNLSKECNLSNLRRDKGAEKLVCDYACVVTLPFLDIEIFINSNEVTSGLANSTIVSLAKRKT